MKLAGGTVTAVLERNSGVGDTKGTENTVNPDSEGLTEGQKSAAEKKPAAGEKLSDREDPATGEILSGGETPETEETLPAKEESTDREDLPAAETSEMGEQQSTEKPDAKFLKVLGGVLGTGAVVAAGGAGVFSVMKRRKKRS